MSESNATVRYEERDTIAIVTLNRPERLNTLTEAVVQGVADGIDRATASKDVRAVVDDLAEAAALVAPAAYAAAAAAAARSRPESEPASAPSSCSRC